VGLSVMAHLSARVPVQGIVMIAYVFTRKLGPLATCRQTWDVLARKVCWAA
jgi:hypothetical protein